MKPRKVGVFSRREMLLLLPCKPPPTNRAAQPERSAKEEEVQPVSLLNLPSELRIMIYRYALHSPNTIQIDCDNFMQPALLRTNRQMRAEATEIYYWENKFVAEADYINQAALIIFYLVRGAGFRLRRTPRFPPTTWPGL
jgi:hypothetical protein